MDEIKVPTGKTHMDMAWHEAVDNKQTFVYAIKEIPVRKEYYFGQSAIYALKDQFPEVI